MAGGRHSSWTSGIGRFTHRRNDWGQPGKRPQEATLEPVRGTFPGECRRRRLRVRSAGHSPGNAGGGWLRDRSAGHSPGNAGGLGSGIRRSRPRRDRATGASRRRDEGRAELSLLANSAYNQRPTEQSCQTAGVEEDVRLNLRSLTFDVERCGPAQRQGASARGLRAAGRSAGPRRVRPAGPRRVGRRTSAGRASRTSA